MLNQKPKKNPWKIFAILILTITLIIAHFAQQRYADETQKRVQDFIKEKNKRNQVEITVFN